MSLSAYSLQCEHRAEPLGIDEPRPSFSWKLAASSPGRSQLAYRLTVRDANAAQPCWDSGWVETADHHQVIYAGPPLEPSARYAWHVQLTDDLGNQGEPTGSWFETGLLTPGGWTARWIRRDPRTRPRVDPPREGDPDLRTGLLAPPCQFRREFELASPPAYARAYVTARGLYQLRLNGARVGRDELTPGWTDYHHRLQYQVYDITDQLRAGLNAVGAIVADGWWCGHVGFDPRQPAFHYGRYPELLAQIHITCQDGTSMVVTTDGHWTESPGQVLYADPLIGEAHDQRLATPGWDQPGYDDSSWAPALGSELDAATLVAQIDEPVRVTMEVPAQAVWPMADGYLADFGQNLVGRVRLRLRNAPAGTRVQIRHGEILDDGRLYTANLRSAEATDVVITAGPGGAASFEPYFATHGFRYAEVTGWPGELERGDVVALVTQSDMPVAGELHCSDPMVEQLVSNIVWGQRGNYVSIPTDCPQRDERLGWTADTQIFLPTACFHADVAAFIGKWLRDVIDEQDEDGAFGDVAPRIVVDREGAPAWGDAGVIVPFHLWRVYGDRRLLERCYPAMRAWVEHIHRHNPDLIWRHADGNSYGDWLQIGAHTPREVVATAYFARSASLAAEAAAVLGLSEESERYRALAAGIRQAFATEFARPDGTVATGSQTSYLMALAWELISSDLRDSAFGHLCRDIEDRGTRLTTGFVGVPLLCPVLSEGGRPDLAFALLHQEEFPSWGYSIRQGATTIWERWDGWTEEHGFQSPHMNSFNHYSLGSVGEWLWRSVAGIDQSPGSVAYSDLVIAPQFGPRLEWVTARYDSPRGVVQLRWRHSPEAVEIELEVPPGRPAELRLPASVAGQITVDGMPVEDHPWARLLDRVEGVARVSLFPGSWSVRCTSGPVATTSAGTSRQSPADMSD
jgi:alpha-L-rhamnosidase